MFGADPLEALARLLVDAEAGLRGFIVEGAAMGAALRDALPFERGLLQALRNKYAANYEYLIVVGAGWAIARTPWRARTVLAGLPPLLRPLASDGQGFHDLYFARAAADPQRLVNGRRERPRAYANGVGRAVWFVTGGDVVHALAEIERYPGPVQPRLLSGLALAMAYAGPADESDWCSVLMFARSVPDAGGALLGDARLDVGQGVAFAAEALHRGGSRPPNLEVAARAVLGVGAEAAAGFASATRPPLAAADPPAAYHGWRTAVAQSIRALEAEGAA